MNVNFNISPAVLERLVVAIEQLAQDYRTVHADKLQLEESLNKPVDKSVGRTYYQDDSEIYKQEQEEKRRRIAEYGEEGPS